MAVKVKVKDIKPAKVAYMEHIGPYDKIPFNEYFGKLMGWAKEGKVKINYRLIMGIYHSDPKTTPPDELKSWIAMGLKSEGKETDDIKIRELAAAQCALLKYKGGTEVIERAYKDLDGWIEENGYEVAGPIMEVYTGKPKVKDGKTIIKAVVHAPVKKKQA